MSVCLLFAFAPVYVTASPGRDGSRGRDPRTHRMTRSEACIKSISNVTNGAISYARFYVGVSNLFTFTKYKGYDPEVTRQQSFAGGENQFLNGYDNGNAPQSRMLQVGWQINF